MEKEEKSRQETRFFAIIAGLFVAVLLISNTASTKIVALGVLVFDGGTLLFPLSYIFGDILTEVYGYGKARKVIWIGFFSALLMAAVFAVVGTVPRIVLASLIAYFAGEFSNSFVLAKMKILTKGKMLWTRTIGSTIVGEGIDTALFATIAFYGSIPLGTFYALVASNYVFKVGIEVAFTPITYKAVKFLKREEKMDYYDYKTNFSRNANG